MATPARSSALARALRIAAETGGEVIVHSKSGKITAVHVLPRQKLEEQEGDPLLAKLRAAGVLATNLGVPPDVEYMSDEELELTGDMRPGARPSEELIDEDRGR
jgi:hypothetical protein